MGELIEYGKKALEYGNDAFPRGLAMALVRKLEEDWRRK